MSKSRIERKTQTLGYAHDPDSPGMVICKGHVTAEEFNEAFQNEGWSDHGDYRQEDLTHGYGCWTGDHFEFSKTKDDEFNKPYTYCDWD